VSSPTLRTDDGEKASAQRQRALRRARPATRATPRRRYAKAERFSFERVAAAAEHLASRTVTADLPAAERDAVVAAAVRRRRSWIGLQDLSESRANIHAVGVGREKDADRYFVRVHAVTAQFSPAVDGELGLRGPKSPKPQHHLYRPAVIARGPSAGVEVEIYSMPPALMVAGPAGGGGGAATLAHPGARLRLPDGRVATLGFFGTNGAGKLCFVTTTHGYNGPDTRIQLDGPRCHPICTTFTPKLTEAVDVACAEFDDGGNGIGTSAAFPEGGAVAGTIDLAPERHIGHVIEKLGATTWWTEGVVVTTRHTLNAWNETTRQLVTLTNQILVRRTADAERRGVRLLQPGDSGGGLILRDWSRGTESTDLPPGRIAGVLCAGDLERGAWFVASPVSAVLAALGLTI
jgi:hypothetical protein